MTIKLTTAVKGFLNRLTAIAANVAKPATASPYLTTGTCLIASRAMLNVDGIISFAADVPTLSAGCVSGGGNTVMVQIIEYLPDEVK